MNPNRTQTNYTQSQSQYRRTLRALHDRIQQRTTIRLVREDSLDEIEDRGWLDSIRQEWLDTKNRKPSHA